MRTGKGHEFPFKPALAQVREIVAVLYLDPPREVFAKLAKTYVNGGPDFLDRVEAAFLLTIGADNSVRGMIAVGIDRSILVRPDYALISR
ncbi:MAG: hypothetical protein ACYTAO_17315 [Planctomycetota bacterium]